MCGGRGGGGSSFFSYLLDDNSVNETKANEKQNQIITWQKKNMRVNCMGSLEEERKREWTLFLHKKASVLINRSIDPHGHFHSHLISFRRSLWITCRISLWLMGVLGYFSKTYNNKP